MVSNKNLTQTFKKILYMFFIYTVRGTMNWIVGEGNKIRDSIVTGKLVKTAERTESLDLTKETLKIKEFLKKERKK